MPREIVKGLPKWLVGLAYSAASNRIAVRVDAKQRDLLGSFVLSMTAEEAQALQQALGRCVEESTRVVLDVKPT